MARLVPYSTVFPGLLRGLSWESKGHESILCEASSLGLLRRNGPPSFFCCEGEAVINSISVHSFRGSYEKSSAVFFQDSDSGG